LAAVVGPALVDRWMQKAIPSRLDWVNSWPGETPKRHRLKSRLDVVSYINSLLNRGPGVSAWLVCRRYGVGKKHVAGMIDAF